MLIVRWIEDKEGCLLANWYDEEKAEHGGFAETVVPMDGREALKIIKGDPSLRDIPVVVLSTSGLDQDIVRS